MVWIGLAASTAATLVVLAIRALMTAEYELRLGDGEYPDPVPFRVRAFLRVVAATVPIWAPILIRRARRVQ